MSDQEIPPEFEEIEAIFRKMPDKKVMNHPDFTGYNGPWCFLHFSSYARELREIRNRMFERDYDFYAGNIEDAKAVATICMRLRKRADLLRQDEFSLKVICRTLEEASKDFRLEFASLEHLMDTNKKSLAITKFVHPFCKKIREFERILDTLSTGSKISDLDFPDLSPN